MWKRMTVKNRKPAPKDKGQNSKRKERIRRNTLPAKYIPKYNDLSIIQQNSNMYNINYQIREMDSSLIAQGYDLFLPNLTRMTIF